MRHAVGKRLGVLGGLGTCHQAQGAAEKAALDRALAKRVEHDRDAEAPVEVGQLVVGTRPKRARLMRSDPMLLRLTHFARLYHHEQADWGN